MTMIRPLNKRPPEIDDDLLLRFAKISKADWADLYFDLFRAVNGETEVDAAIMQDAEERLAILKSYRRAQNAS